MDTNKAMESLRDRDLFFRMLLKIQLFLVDRDGPCPCCEMGFTGTPHKDDCEFALLVRSAIKGTARSADSSTVQWILTSNLPADRQASN